MGCPDVHCAWTGRRLGVRGGGGDQVGDQGGDRGVVWAEDSAGGGRRTARLEDCGGGEGGRNVLSRLKMVQGEVSSAVVVVMEVVLVVG